MRGTHFASANREGGRRAGEAEGRNCPRHLSSFSALTRPARLLFKQEEHNKMHLTPMPFILIAKCSTNAIFGRALASLIEIRYQDKHRPRGGNFGVKGEAPFFTGPSSPFPPPFQGVITILSNLLVGCVTTLSCFCCAQTIQTALNNDCPSKIATKHKVQFTE